MKPIYFSTKTKKDTWTPLVAAPRWPLRASPTTSVFCSITPPRADRGNQASPVTGIMSDFFAFSPCVLINTPSIRSKTKNILSTLQCQRGSVCSLQTLQTADLPKQHGHSNHCKGNRNLGDRQKPQSSLVSNWIWANLCALKWRVPMSSCGTKEGDR